MKNKPLHTVQKKGRWGSTKNLARYEKGARLQDTLGRAPSAAVTFGHAVERRLPELLSGSWRPECLPGAPKGC